MKRINELNQEDAKILLQSQALSSALWLTSADNAHQVSIRLPDPAFADSKNWPSYMKKEEGSTKKTNDSIEFIKKIEPPVISEIKPLETLPHAEIKTEKVDSIYQEIKAATVLENPKSEPKQSIPKSKPNPKIEIEKKSSLPSAESPVIEQKLPTENQNPPQTRRISKNLDFYEWLEELHSGPKSPKKQKLPVEAKLPLKTKSDPIWDTQKAIETSLTLKEEVISETLAKLLAKQGHKQEAIGMYEKLMLKFPEKGSTFASAIEKLKT